MNHSRAMSMILTIVLWCGVSGWSNANEADGIPKSVKSFPNQGFVKGDEKESLKNKFPACDDFLNIEWINQDEGVGYVKHDV